MTKKPTPAPKSRSMNRDRQALRDEIAAAVNRLKLTPACGSEGRAGKRSK